MTTAIPMTDLWDASRTRGVSRRHFLQASAAGAALTAVGPSLWRRAWADAAPPMHPHLAFGADASSQMNVSWRTEGAADGQVARIFRGGDAVTAEIDTRTVRYVSSTQYSHASFDGLDPATTYRYELLDSSGAVSVQSSFKTAPDSAQSFTFTALGDQGTDEVKAGGVNRAVAAADPALHFHVGDLCYAYRFGVSSENPALRSFIDGSAEYGGMDFAKWDQWLALISNPSRVAGGKGAHSIPWMTTIGNHEMEPTYGQTGYHGVTGRLLLPGNGVDAGTGTDRDNVTYTFDYGSVRFIALDGNDTNYEITGNQGYLGDAQSAWLESVLVDANKPDSGIDFIVVGYHQCNYCTNLLHASDAGTRRWDVLFDQYGVDLVINGHNHSYERAHPKHSAIDNPAARQYPSGSVVTPADGTTYITAGAGGNERAEGSAFEPAMGSYVTIEGGIRVPEVAHWSAARNLGPSSFLQIDVTSAVDAPDGQTAMHVQAIEVLSGVRTGVVDEVTVKRTADARRSLTTMD